VGVWACCAFVFQRERDMTLSSASRGRALDQSIDLDRVPGNPNASDTHRDRRLRKPERERARVQQFVPKPIQSNSDQPTTSTSTHPLAIAVPIAALLLLLLPLLHLLPLLQVLPLPSAVGVERCVFAYVGEGRRPLDRRGRSSVLPPATVVVSAHRFSLCVRVLVGGLGRERSDKGTSGAPDLPCFKD
jgi:hypothetical protein